MKQCADRFKQTGFTLGSGAAQINTRIVRQLSDQAAGECIDNLLRWCAVIKLSMGLCKFFCTQCMCVVAVGREANNG